MAITVGWIPSVFVGTVAVVGAAIAALAYLSDWGSETTLVLDRDRLFWDGQGYRRVHIDGFSVEGRHLSGWEDHSKLLHAWYLRHDPTAIGALQRVLENWRSNPSWEHHRPFWRGIAPSLDEWLAPLRPEVDPGGYTIELRSRGELGPHVERIVIGLVLLQLFSPYLALVGILAAGPAWLWRVRLRGSVVLSPLGISIQRGPRLPWSQVRSATLEPAGHVRVHLVDGNVHSLIPLYPGGAAGLADAIDHLARPDQSESEVPVTLHHARRARSTE